MIEGWRITKNDVYVYCCLFRVMYDDPGTRITVELPDGRLLVREWDADSSYLASEDSRLHVELGTI